MDHGEAIIECCTRPPGPIELSGYRPRQRVTAQGAPGPPADDPHALFRRAIVAGDQAAWADLCARYQGLVRLWLRRHPAASLAAEAEDELINRTFARFWRSVGPARFADFDGLPPLLRYLKLCAQSVLLDEARARTRHRALPLAGDAEAAPFEDAVAERAAARALWRAIGAATHDDAELLIARLSFIHGLKPGEIHARHPDRYASVAEVYRLKRNLLDRLRRDPAIRAAYADLDPTT